MRTITYLRTSENYPSYKLGLYQNGEARRFVIYTGDESKGEWDWEIEDHGGWYIVREDGLDLDADFETHCDDLEEEMRVLRADAMREFEAGL